MHKHLFEKQYDSFSIKCKCGLKVSGLHMVSKLAKQEYQEIIINKDTVKDWGI